MKDLEKGIDWMVKNWDKIPEKFKSNIQNYEYGTNDALIPGVSREEHVVVLLLDRQKPSVSQSYDFNEERISVSRSGKIIWGFDSGCSCPSPWSDSYPNCYSCGSWKEFVVNIGSFDEGAVEICLSKIEAIMASMKL